MKEPTIEDDSWVWHFRDADSHQDIVAETNDLQTMLSQIDDLLFRCDEMPQYQWVTCNDNHQFDIIPHVNRHSWDSVIRR